MALISTGSGDKQAMCPSTDMTAPQTFTDVAFSLQEIAPGRVAQKTLYPPPPRVR
jgi:hypothetical protein